MANFFFLVGGVFFVVAQGCTTSNPVALSAGYLDTIESEFGFDPSNPDPPPRDPSLPTVPDPVPPEERNCVTTGTIEMQHFGNRDPLPDGQPYAPGEPFQTGDTPWSDGRVRANEPQSGFKEARLLYTGEPGWVQLYNRAAETCDRQFNETTWLRVLNDQDPVNGFPHPKDANFGSVLIVEDSDNDIPFSNDPNSECQTSRQVYFGTFWLESGCASDSPDGECWGKNTLRLEHFCPMYREFYWRTNAGQPGAQEIFDRLDAFHNHVAGDNSSCLWNAELHDRDGDAIFDGGNQHEQNLGRQCGMHLDNYIAATDEEREEFDNGNIPPDLRFGVQERPPLFGDPICDDDDNQLRDENGKLRFYDNITGSSDFINSVHFDFEHICFAPVEET